MQVVGGAQSRQAVGALFEFISHAETPLRRVLARPGSASTDCRRRASSPRITMAKVFSNPSGSATVTP